MVAKGLSGALNVLCITYIDVELNLREIDPWEFDEAFDECTYIGGPLKTPSHAPPVVLLHPFQASPEGRSRLSDARGGFREERQGLRGACHNPT